MKKFKKTYKKRRSFVSLFIGINMVLLLAIGILSSALFVQKKLTPVAHSQNTPLGFDTYQEESDEKGPVLGVQQNSAVILHGDRSKPEIALTFDAEMTDGMKQWFLSGHPSYDPRIVATLTATHTPATFFLTGLWTELYPTVAKSIAQNSLFEIGSHSYIDSAYTTNCYGLEPTIDNDDLEQMESTQLILRQLTGHKNKLFRFPGGCYDTYDVQVATQTVGLTIVHWDVAPGDGFNNNAQSIINNVLNTTQNGSIIVMHLNGAPTAPRTADALPTIISELKKKGFTFVTVSKLLNL